MMTGAQVRMARAALQWGVRELAERAKVSPNTVTKIEADQSANNASLAALQNALENAGVAFLTNGGVVLHQDITQATFTVDPSMPTGTRRVYPE